MTRGFKLAWFMVFVAACGGESVSEDQPGGSGGSGSSGAGGTSAGAPQDIASTQTVTLELTNVSNEDRFVVTQGMYCTHFGIAAEHSGSYSTLALQMGFQCLCECANPGQPHATDYRRIAPGESWSTTWDARKLVTYSEDYDCAEHGWPGAGVQQQLQGVQQPVATGNYRWTLAVETSLPESCTPDGEGIEYSCWESAPGSYQDMPGAIAAICPSASLLSVDFALPESGDIAVTAEIP